MLKVATIVFTDVVGSTARAETMHPEDTRALMTDFFQAMSEEIAREGGTIEHIAGDGFMAAFGVPRAHEDDPARAVRASRAMLDRLARWNDGRDAALQIEVRIGINTGEVSAASARGQHLLVTGDAVNVAARLQEAADPGTILIGARTARCVQNLFRLEQRPAVELKGKTLPVPAYLVQEEVPPGESTRRLLAPFVGRNHELATLRTVFDHCCRTATPHLMSLIGDAGVGKSRLIDEFLAVVGAEARVVEGRCVAYGEGATLWPLREILSSVAGTRDSDAYEVAKAKIDELVSRTNAAHDGAARRMSAGLAATVGLEPEELASLDPRSRHREVRVAWRSLLTALAADQPLVLVIQDIHWADELMLDVLDDLVCHTSGPILFVCAARPELLKVKPNWGAGLRNATTLRLDPLSSEDSSALVARLLDVDDLPMAVKNLILERCEGNPFFLEEVLQHLLDEGRLERDGERLRVRGQISTLEIPDNVQGVLLARIDLLSPEEKEIGQRAAVVGRAFWEGVISRLSPTPALPQLLGELERRSFILERPGSSISGEIEYAFTHILIRDVAYQTMPRKLRGLTHEGVAAWIEDATGARRDEFAELLAHHYIQAHSLLERGDLRKKARSYCLEASVKALRRFAVEQALTFGRRAVELSEPGPEMFEALEAMGDTSLTAYCIDDAWAAYVEALDTASATATDADVTRLAAKAAISAARYEGAMKVLPAAEDVRRVIELGLERAGAADDRDRCVLLASKLFAQGVGYEPSTEEGERAATEAFALAEKLEDADAMSLSLDAAAFWLATETRYRDTYELQARRVDLVPRLSDIQEVCDVYGSASWSAYYVGRYDEAIAHATECLKRAEGVDAGNYEHALQWRVMARFRRGDWDGALEDQAKLEELVGARETETLPVFVGGAYSTAFYCHTLRGHTEDAARYFDALQTFRSDLEAIGEKLGMPLGSTARALLHRGDIDAAAEWLSEAPNFSRGPYLEAVCELTAAQADWSRAADVVAEVRSDAELMGCPTLQAFADRLAGRAAGAEGRVDDAEAAFAASIAAFAAAPAPWEEALSRLLRAELRAGHRRPGAADEARDSLSVFARLGSVTEAARADALLAHSRG